MKIKSANGVEGFLIWCGDNKFRFRVYPEEGGFIDYDILHCDLQVNINDADAYFYTEGDRNILDHSPETLGVRP